MVRDSLDLDLTNLAGCTCAFWGPFKKCSMPQTSDGGKVWAIAVLGSRDIDARA